MCFALSDYATVALCVTCVQSESLDVVKLVSSLRQSVRSTLAEYALEKDLPRPFFMFVEWSLVLLGSSCLFVGLTFACDFASTDASSRKTTTAGSCLSNSTLCLNLASNTLSALAHSMMFCMFIFRWMDTLLSDVSNQMKSYLAASKS